MKQALQKTEFRKTALFVLFTALVLWLLYIDAEFDNRNAAAGTVIEAVDR